MHWVLQDNLFKETEWQSLVDHLERWNIPYSVHKVVPFVGELIPDIDISDGKAVCFGSYSMRHIAKKKGWTPGVYDLEPFNFLMQLEHWGKEMLNADAWVGRFGDAKFEGSKFIRPILDSKSFAGRVFDQEEFSEWQSKIHAGDDFGDSVTSDTIIQVCEPKEIWSEVRYWIVDGNIVTRSIYKIGDRVQYSDQVDSRFDYYASALVQPSIIGWNPLPAFVLDVCETPEGMKIVEINTINAAGFYAGDIPSIIMALEDLENE